MVPISFKNKKVWMHFDGKTVFIRGEIDGLNPNPYLNQFFNQVTRVFPKELIIDVTELSYLNSRAISSLITFLNQRPPNSKIYFKINEKYVWQKRSIEILTTLDPRNLIIKS